MHKMYKYTMDGAPRYLNFKPTPAALAAMHTKGRGITSTEGRAQQDAKAIAYATWYLTSRGIIAPPPPSSTLQVRVVRDWPKAPLGAPSRPRFVHWVVGAKRDQYAGRGRRQYYNGRKWEDSYTILIFEIPHWDHVPTCHALEQLREAA